MKNKRVNLPISFSKAEFDDDRFLKVRVKVMHSGLNLNQSNFDANVIEDAKPTLANIPLLAFVKKMDGEDTSDFAGHEWELKITNNEMKYVYLGRPIGIVPETNNYEFSVDESGKQFVSVDAYVWKDYANEALDIFERDQAKKVSMEINAYDYEIKDSFVDIKKYAYTGIAVLGDEVSEAMIGAKAEVIRFSENSINGMMLQLKDAMQKFAETNKEVDDAEENIEDVEENVEDIQENTEDNLEDSSNEDADSEDHSENKDSDEQDDTEDLDPEMNEDSEENKETQTENSDEFTNAENGNTENSDTEEKKSEGEENFSKNDESVATPLVNDEEVENLKIELQNLRQENETLKNELDSLKEFKANTEKIEKQRNLETLFSSFEDLAELKEFSIIKENAENDTLEMTELKLFALRGKYATGNGLIATNFTSNADEPDWLKLVKQNLNK